MNGGRTERGATARTDSMDLLREIQASAVDPDYTRERAWAQGGRAHRWAQLPVFAAAAALFAMSMVLTTRAAPQIQTDRAAMVTAIEATQKQQDQLRQEIAATRAETYALQQKGLASDAGNARIAGQVEQLSIPTGAAPVVGPGLVIVVDDASTGAADARVIDTDLQQLVNGLWQAGAEGIAINDHRLTGLTAIRGAGDAITVDYRSLTRPYTIAVIGDPNSLQQTFITTDGGVWWNYLEKNIGIRMTITRQKKVQLPAATRVTLRQAKGGTP
ncbi:DUF881 domain-containing protein [Raineyella sp. LH-20]|uniref:DUF881 domain-containing protein n=1 Tax=Raineyella sp. LH-20 TaxID=3081204 RepID=UPI0029551CD4|nr:DUF881 domain-containing protein [Raineyella sp. LH-20]WOP18115.1 DUF881 domain-containing protein [Raineyella sp. LH-20]